MLTIGIDIGGTKIAAGVVDDAGAIVARRVIPTEAQTPAGIVAGATKVAAEMRAAAPAAAAVGVGVAGLVDGARGVFLDGPNLSLRNVAVGPMLAERVGVPVSVDNDANVAALGEALHGAGRGFGDQIMITVGTGIGGGIVIGGQIYRGATGVGGELGHMVVLAGGPRCACGNDGCWEAMASGTALGRMARERADDPSAASVLRAAGSAGAVTGEIVGDAAVAGDAFARELVAEAGRWLGVGLANVVNIFDPKVIVVGGGVAAGLGDLLLQPAREAMAPLIVGNAWRPAPPVIPAALGNDAGVVGAAALARLTYTP